MKSMETVVGRAEGEEGKGRRRPVQRYLQRLHKVGVCVQRKEIYPRYTEGQETSQVTHRGGDMVEGMSEEGDFGSSTLDRQEGWRSFVLETQEEAFAIAEVGEDKVYVKKSGCPRDTRCQHHPPLCDSPLPADFL